MGTWTTKVLEEIDKEEQENPDEGIMEEGSTEDSTEPDDGESLDEGEAGSEEEAGDEGEPAGTEAESADGDSGDGSVDSGLESPGETEGDTDQDSGAGTADKVEEEGEPEEGRLYKVTIDGEDAEVDEDELIRGYQRSKASFKRFEEAKQVETEARGVLERLVKNPVETMLDMLSAQLNGDREGAEEAYFQLNQDFIGTYLESRFAPEEKRQAMKAERELKRKKSEIAELDREKALRDQEKEMIQYAQQLDRDIGEALKATEMPNDPDIIKDIANLIQLGIKHEVIVSPLQAATEIKGEREKRINNLSETLSEKDFLERYPEKAEAISRAFAEKLRAKAPSTKKPRARRETVPSSKDGTQSKRRKKDEPFGTRREFHDYMLNQSD